MVGLLVKSDQIVAEATKYTTNKETKAREIKGIRARCRPTAQTALSAVST